MASAASEFVLLKGGLTVPVAPLLLLLDLEARGLRVKRDGDDLTVYPGDLLTEQDCQLIRCWKRHILTLLSYSPDEVM
jgi:hypothetical protein